MPRVITHREEHGAWVYEFALHLDDAALTDGHIAIGVEARRWPRERPDAVQHVTAEVTIQREDERLMLVVALNAGGAGIEAQSDELRWDLSQFVSVEQVLEAIPAWALTGDPITGCMVRAGLSTVVGQLLNCKNETAQINAWRERLLALGRCMVRHVPDMTTTAIRRTLGCIARFGF
jgi:hypothetical protein